MTIIDAIKSTFKRGSNVLVNQSLLPFSYGITQHRFGDVIFANMCEIMTDLCNDVTLVNLKPRENIAAFAEFKAFFDKWGRFVENRLYHDGFVVIGKTPLGYKILGTNEYHTLQKDGDKSIVEANDPTIEVYVMRSECWLQRNMSDRQFCSPFITYLDNVLNASNTASERLGNMVVASPKSPNNAPTAFVLPEQEKIRIEKQLQEEYGGLHEQRQICLLPREMAFQVISLAGVDMKTYDKAKMAILAIADRIRIPANQIAFINADSSKSLSNGGELREGDFAKYQSFERLLNQTFIEFAKACGLTVSYEIYNKPSRQVAQTV